MATTTLWHESASSDERDGNLLTFARRQGLQALNTLDRTTFMGFSGAALSTLLSDSLAFSVIESDAVAVGQRLLELVHRSIVVAAVCAKLLKTRGREDVSVGSMSMDATDRGAAGRGAIVYGSLDKQAAE